MQQRRPARLLTREQTEQTKPTARPEGQQAAKAKGLLLSAHQFPLTPYRDLVPIQKLLHCERHHCTFKFYGH